MWELAWRQQALTHRWPLARDLRGDSPETPQHAHKLCPLLETWRNADIPVLISDQRVIGDYASFQKPLDDGASILSQ
jgi:hypothetical protein